MFRNGYRKRAIKNLCSEMERERERGAHVSMYKKVKG